MVVLVVPLDAKRLCVAAHQIGDGILFKKQREHYWGWQLKAQI